MVIRITAYGATAISGDPIRYDGIGAKISGTFELEKNDKLLILSGQRDDTRNGGSPGGGTFVAKVDSTSSYSMNDGSGYKVMPLVIAGGGGGIYPNSATNHTVQDASITTTAKTPDYGSYGIGGENGEGGTSPTSNYYGASGGGFLTDGGNNIQGATGGKSFLNGGAGGNQNSTSYNNGGYGSAGGGGTLGPGGGGGYSGGGGGYYSKGSGGGASYNSGTNQEATLRTETTNSGLGFVEIEILKIGGTSLFIKSSNTFRPTKHILKKENNSWISPIKSFMKMSGV